MRVTHVITRLIRGGAQLTLLNLLKAQASRGLDCTVVSGPEAGPEGSILEEVRGLGIPVEILDDLRRDPAPVRDLAALETLARGFMRRGTVLAHLHTSKAGLLGGLAARLAGVPAVVYTAQGHIFASQGAIPGVTDRPRLRPVFMLMRRTAEACAHRVVALTEADLEEQVALGLASRAQYAVIPNGVDPAPFDTLPPKAEARRRLGLPAGVPLVIAVGRLSPEKGQDLLLEALAFLPAGVHAVLVGDGPTRASLEVRSAQADLAGRVHFLGLRTDVPTCLAAADAAALPSRYEAQGMAVVEAMLARLPVAAFRVGGVPGILEHGRTGLLVPPADPTAFAAALASLLDDAASARALGEQAAAHARARLSTSAMADAYDALYRDLLS